MIRLRAVSKRYEGSPGPAVDAIDLHVLEGELMVLVGPSGCGKTTTLRLVNRMIEPSSGRIEVGGRPIVTEPAHQLRRRIGYVIQDGGLFPHRTVAQNIATVPRLLGWSRQQIQDRTSELLRLVGLPEEFSRRYPSTLSGGERQRVGVARALAADPPILLMDEPFGAVDPLERRRLQDELLRLQSAVRKTVVLVTHDIDEAIRLGDRVAVYRPAGTIAQCGAPDDVLRDPADSFVESFFGADRGLRRLGLRTVQDLDLTPGRVIDLRAAREGRAIAHRDWAVVMDGERMLGWTSDSVALATGADPSSVIPFRHVLDPSDDLRSALNAVLDSPVRCAPVVNGDRFLGLVTLDDLGR